MSVLFADLVGFTGRSERLDVEDVERLLAPYHELLRESVEQTGGTVAKFTGDGVMALFGADVAHEDDPERAVRCGIAIRDAIASADAGDSNPLQVRVGVTTGEALVTVRTDGSVDAVGDVVNTAARLEGAASPGGVLIDDYTRRTCERTIVLEPVDPILAKGKSEPMAAWQAVVARSPVWERPRANVPLVGRLSESNILREVFDRSCRERSVQLVSIIGEPGIGKTRLVEEFHAAVSNAPHEAIWRRGRSLSYGQGVALWALGEIIKQQAGILESDPAETVQDVLATSVTATVADVDAGAWMLRHLRPLVGLGADVGLGDESRLEAFSAWRQFIEAVAETAPTVLVFEDIHWADDVLLDFIDELADRATAVPLTIVCTSRPELLERRPSWAGGKVSAHTILLQPLSETEATILVERLLETASIPAPLRSAVLEPIAGNPLYAQEFIRMLQDRSVLVKDNGGWVIRGEAPGMPESIHGVIAARLDTLSPTDKSFVQDASVIGRTAWIGAVCQLSERSAGEADEALHRLERKQLLRRVRHSSIKGETEFQFGHALTTDVAYAQIQRRDRALKHEQTAAWIEALAGERVDKAELLADHYTKALELRQALGESTGDVLPKALAALMEAGRQAASASAHASASRHYRTALSLAPRDDLQLRAPLLLGLVTAAINQGVVDEAMFEETAAAQLATEDWEAAAELEWRCSNWYEQHAGSGHEATLHLERAGVYAARGPLSTTACLIAAARARRLLNAGQSESALELTSDLIPQAERANLPVGRAVLVGWRGLSRFELGDGTGVEDIRDAAASLAQLAHERTGTVYANLGNTLRALGDMDSASAAYDEAARWADRVASVFQLDWTAAERAYQAYHAGHWAAAEAMLTKVSGSAAFAENGARLVRGRIDLGRAQIEAALGSAFPIVEYAANTGDDQSLYYGQALAARCHDAAGREAEAAESCRQMLSRWVATHGLVGCAIEICEITYILALAGRDEEIGQAGAVLPPTCRWREAILLTAGKHYSKAAAVYDELGSAPLAADARLLAAGQSAVEKRIDESREQLDAVVAFADKAGATLYRQHAERLRH